MPKIMCVKAGRESHRFEDTTMHVRHITAAMIH